MDLIEQLGELAFLSRLRRLCEHLAKDASRIYKSRGVDFEARWFPVTYLLRDHSPMSVTEVANALGMSHPSVNQIASAMTKRGLLSSSMDRGDERRRLLSLTEEGHALVKQLEPIWRDISEATRELLESTGMDVLRSIARIEDDLERSSVYERVMNRMKVRQYESVEIVDYKPVYRRHFESLNREWLDKHFEVEPCDNEILSDPNGKILKKGGYVFFAKLNGDVIGTCALLKVDEKTFEIAKLAVTSEAQGQQVGRKLTETAIERARSRHAESVVLETSVELRATTNLYRKLGFVKVEYEGINPPKCKRPSIRMKLDLKQNST